MSCPKHRVPHSVESIDFYKIRSVGKEKLVRHYLVSVGLVIRNGNSKLICNRKSSHDSDKLSWDETFLGRKKKLGRSSVA